MLRFSNDTIKWLEKISFHQRESLAGFTKQSKREDEEKMVLKFNIMVTSLLFLLASVVHVSSDTVFDVTKYGARADGVTDVSQVRTMQI